MARVTIYNDNFEKGMRKFKKKVMNEGILQEVRERQYFEKPSMKKNRKKAAARMRWLKKKRESEINFNKDF